ISYSARGVIADLDVERMGNALDVPAMAKPEYASRINGTFDVTGSLPRRPAGRREGESTIAEMTLDASGRLKDAEIMGGRLPDLGFEVKLAGGALDGRLDGQFERFDPARIAARPDLAGEVTGVINATVKVADVSAPITPESITGAGTLSLSNSRVGEIAIETANLDASYANQVADVKQFTLVGPDVKADASGRVALDRTTTSNLKYHVEALDLPELARLAGQTDIGGTVVVDGTITGNRASLTTSGTLNGSNISYQENNALNLNSAFTVTVPELEFAKAKVDATTKGTFIKAGGLEISELTAKTVYDQQRVTFTTNVKEKTRELDASGTVILHPDHQELHLPQLTLRTAGVEWRSKPGVEATIQYFPDRVVLKNVELVNAGQLKNVEPVNTAQPTNAGINTEQPPNVGVNTGQPTSVGVNTEQFLSVNGTVALKGDAPSAALDVVARNIDIRQLESLLLQNRGFAGKLNLNAKVTGTTEAPAVDGHVEIHNGAFKTYKYESFIADIDYVGRRVSVDATLQQTPAERITVKGSAPMSLFTPSQTSEHVPAGPEDAVDLHVTSTALGLGLVQGFTDYLANVAGTVEADFRVTGSGQDPHLLGHIDIRNGAFGVPLGGVSYSGLNTRIDLTPDKVTLKSFQIVDEHGEPLNVTGDLAVHEKSVGAVNIRIDSANFEVIDNELGDVGLDTSITISGELRRPKIAGTVRVEAGRIEVDRLLTFFYDPYATESLPAVVSSERMVEGSGSAEEATRAALRKAEVSAAAAPEEKKPEAPPAPASIFDGVELDVAFVMPDNLVLRGKNLRPGGPTGAALGDMNITIGGEMAVRKAPGDQIRLTGTVETVRGTYEFQGRRFDLERGGRIRFVGETEINPFLDISATRLIPNTGVEAKVRITGTLQQPELSLTSTPALEESDILALIVFNRPVNELGSGERSSLAATAGGIATGFIAAPLGESIGRALDLDLFEITTTTESGELGAGITLGQQIGDKAFLKLRQEFGERNTTEFMLEYQLARFLRMQASAAPQTTGSANRLNQRRIERGGLDLIFFFSY
ncbi:MAG TPA: translocation/assembly module TamB, partial [Vicinamibacterales bacterium]|nr:translocation/assembly module TamB [Vicinamibacterales bacterium]